MEIIEKLGDIVNNIIKGISLKNIQISDEEYKELESILYEFVFLYSYPNDNQLYNEEYINKAFSNNMFFEKLFIKNSNEFNQLTQDRELKKNLEENNYHKNTTIINDSDRLNIYERNEIYEKEDEVVKKYVTLQENKNQYFLNEWKNVAKCLVPFELTEEKLIELVNKNEARKTDDDSYMIKVTSNLVLRRELDRKFYKDYVTKGIVYRRYKDKFVVNAFLENGIYNIIEEIKEKQLGFLFFDKHGNKIENDSINYIDLKILKKMRDAISHDNVYDYTYDAGQTNKHYGKIFILKDKDDKEDNFKCSLLFLSRYLDPLSNLNCYNSDPETSVFRFLMVPNTKNRISTNEDAVNYQKRIKVVSIKVKQEINETYFVESINEIIEQYSIIPANAPELSAFLNKHVKLKFPAVEIKVEDVANIDLINSKCLNNPLLRKLNARDGHDQEKYLYNVLTKYYGVDCLSEDWLKSVPFIKRIRLQNKGMLQIAFNLLKLAGEMYKDTKVADKHAQRMMVYGTEIYLFYCLISLYANFIKNSFVEDLDRKQNPYANSYENLQNINLRTIEQKVYDEDLSMFKFYRDVDERTAQSPQKKDKFRVLKWIKNGLCHDGVYLKSPLEKNVENQVLIFKSETDAKHPQSHKPIKINNTVEVRCGDLLKFCSKPIFANYKSELHQRFEVKTFDELINIATKLLNKKD